MNSMYVAVIIIVVIVQEGFAASCPAQCVCLDGNADCQNRYFTAIPNGFSIDYKTIELNGNHIESIAKGSFVGLKNLQILLLINIKLRSIDGGAFTGLVNLNRLDLSHNDLTNIISGIFTDLVNLKQLDLSNNNLKRIISGTFAVLVNLETLLLSNNKLTSVDGGAFAGLANLAALYLSNNELTSIEGGAFTGLANLKTLHLNKNYLKSIINGIFAGLVNLESLCLSNNKLTSLEDDAFAGLANLRALFLSNNELTSIEGGAFTGLVNLKTLDLSYNTLKRLIRGTFAVLVNLVSLLLSNNKLTSIEGGAFAGLANLTALFLSNNELMVIEGGEFTGLANLKTLTLNSLQCDCHIWSFLNELLSKNLAVGVQCKNGIPIYTVQLDCMSTTTVPIPTKSRKEILKCPTEHSNDIMWNNTDPGVTNIQSCPHGFKGQASRYCSIDGHKGKWQTPNMDNCTRISFASILQRIKRIQDGVAVDALGKVLNDFANKTEAVTKANKTVVTDLRSSIDILVTASIILSGREDNPTPEEKEAFFSATNNIMDINTKDVWKELHEKTGENKAAKILDIVSNISHLILKTLSKNGSFHFVGKNLALQIQRQSIEQITYTDRNFSTHLILPKSTILNSFNVSETVDYTAAYYTTISKFLQRKSDRLLKDMVSDVISFSVNNNKLAKKLSPPIKLFFKIKQTNFATVECSYWDFTLPYGGNWATDGCELVFTNESAVECRCDHMTNFAVLLSIIEIGDEHHIVLTNISITGCTVSIVCLVFTMIFYALVWKNIHSDRAKSRNSDKDVILVLLCLFLICAYLTFMLGIDRTQNKVICTAVAVLLHFLFLAVLCLMAAEGIIHAVLVMAVFKPPAMKKYLIPLSLVIPVVIVTISGVGNGLNGYGTDKFCWLSVDRGLIYVFFVPCILVVSVNWIIAGVVLKTVISIKTNKDKNRRENLKTGIRSIFLMAPVFGLTWLFGLFSFIEHAIVFSYLFVIFNSLQGATIFLIHVFMDDGVRNALSRRVCGKQQYYGTQSTDTTNTRSILKLVKNDTATFSSDDGAIGSNDIPLVVFHRKKV